MRPVDIRTDSAYVHNGITKHMKTWKKNGWQKKNKLICHADLWQQLHTILKERAGDSVVMTKVVAHATAIDVRSGRTTAFDKWGNDNADVLAVAGAMGHPERTDREKRLQDMLVVTSVQRMMMDILTAREERRKQKTDDVVEVSSGTDDEAVIEVSSESRSAADMEPD